MNKKIFVAVSIGLMILTLSVLGGLLVFTDVYNEVERKIVKTLCLSCIKLKINTDYEWLFETADDLPHQNFVLDNLSKGPVILVYRIAFCPGCDKLEEEVLFPVFNTTFSKEEVFHKSYNFYNTNITFIHINTDEVSENSERYKSRFNYDVVGDRGNPMITLVSYNYHHGFIIPVYATLYGLKKETPEDRQEEFRSLINESVQLYNEHLGAID
jgi:thiol-disulfide isomerase/thioredoxin